MASVRLDGVRKVYDDGQVAVAGATFEVADGELLVLVGPSGCGKSTTLRMIAGLEPVSAGTIAIDGRVVNDEPPKDRDIAMVFQSYALYPHMTVAENLAFGLELRKQPKSEIELRVRQAAEMLGLGEMLARRPRQLSGGQRQRVALGRALVREPKVFLLDEPLSNLDAKLRATMRTEIAKLHRSLGATMIYVTHDQVEAMTLGQRIVVFKSGEIQQIDTPMGLYERPANVFVAGFLGNPAMNILRGRLARDEAVDGDALQLELGAAVLPLGRPPFDELGRQVGQEVIVGVRPEDLQVVDIVAATGNARFAVVVETVETVGSEAYVHGRFGGREIVVRTPSRSLPRVGEPVSLSFLPERLHLFDARDERRLPERRLN
jgi:multiple sugar transport system ATP-binding protein